MFLFYSLDDWHVYTFYTVRIESRKEDQREREWRSAREERQHSRGKLKVVCFCEQYCTLRKREKNAEGVREKKMFE